MKKQKQFTHKEVVSPQKRQKGFVEVSMPFIFLIVALMTAAILATVTAAMDSAKSSQLASGNSLLVNNIRSNYRSSSNFSTLSNASVVTMKAAPALWVKGASSIENEYNGTVTIASTNITGTDDGFSVVHTGLEDEACADFVDGSNGQAYTITVGSTVVKAAGTSTIDGAAIGTACSSATNTVSIVYTKY